jgi:hypothetical protein
MSIIRNAKIVGENVDPREYHKQIGARGDSGFVMSSSQLKGFLDCPLEWHAGVEHEDTKSTDWGNIVDCLTLTPDRWNQHFSVCPETYPDKKTGEQKPWTFKADYCKQWREDRLDKQIVTQEESKLGMDAWHALRENQIISSIIDGSTKQVHVSAEYYDETVDITVPLRALIDLVPGTLPKCLVDLKTCRSVHPRAFQKHVHEYGYALSAAFYLDMFNAATGQERNDFRFILQKNEAPWTTGLRFLSAEWIEHGRRQCTAALREYAICLKRNNWPSHEERAAERGAVVIDGFMEVGPEPYMVGGW